MHQQHAQQSTVFSTHVVRFDILSLFQCELAMQKSCLVISVQHGLWTWQ